MKKLDINKIFSLGIVKVNMENLGKLIIRQVLIKDLVIFAKIYQPHMPKSTVEGFIYEFIEWLDSQHLLENVNIQSLKNKVNDINHPSGFDYVIVEIVLQSPQLSQYSE